MRRGSIAITILLAAACATKRAPPPEQVSESEPTGETGPTTSAPIVWPVELDNPNGREAPSSSLSLPANREVCGHVMRILERELGGEQTLSETDWAAFLDKCATDLETEKQKIGPVEFELEMQCIMAAQQMDELLACEPKPQ
jgi:hypothetical protein